MSTSSSQVPSRRQGRRHQLIVGATTVLVLAAGTTVVVARTALAAHHETTSLSATASNSPSTSHSSSPTTSGSPSAPSSRSPVTVMVPNVVGMPADQAMQALSAGGFTVVQKSLPGSSAPVGVVFTQSPLAGTLAPTGKPVTIDISTGTPGTSSTAGTVACSASQFVVGTPIDSPGDATVYNQADFVTQPLYNSGAACTFNIPDTVEVASATNPFHVVRTDTGYATSYNIPHDTSVTVTLGASWRIPGLQFPGSTLPTCDAPITNVSRVAIPIDASNLQITLGNLWHWQKVCTTPANVSINVQR